jgi:hypothetical protein
MSNFASRYSKDAVTKKEGRGQLPVMTKEGKEELENLLKAALTSMKLETSDYGDFSLLVHFYLGCPTEQNTPGLLIGTVGRGGRGQSRTKLVSLYRILLPLRVCIG